MSCSITLFVVALGAANSPPIAVASASPTSGTAPLTVAFDGTASHDPDGSIASYSWSFGDGATGSGATVNHMYSNTGSYIATLTVTDNRGATASTSVAITVNTDPNVISAQSNLAARTSRSGVVTLTWTDGSTNEQGFYIERAPSGTSNFARVGQVAANVTTYSESPGSGRYAYRVQAYNLTTGRVSTYSNQVSVRVK